MPLIENKHKKQSVKIKLKGTKQQQNVGCYISILAHVASSIEEALESTSKEQTPKQVEVEQAAQEMAIVMHNNVWSASKKGLINKEYIPAESSGH